MEQKQAVINVHAESTPNPATMKFVADKLMVEDGSTVEYTSAEQATGSPLAKRLFNYSFVTGVFFTSNFVTVTKSDKVEWDDVVQEIREYIREFLNSGRPVIMGQEQSTHQEEDTADQEVQPEGETEKKIVELLETHVRPAVEQDGGAIHFKSYKDGVVTVTLRGACSGCPNSMITLKDGIEALLMRMLPEVKEVVAENM